MSLQGKKILSIYYKHKPGGLCKRLYMMFNALTDAGGEVHYIAVEPYPISHAKVIPHLLWTPFHRTEGVFFWIYFIATAPFYALWIGYRFKVDIVSVFGAVYGFLALLLKGLLGKPILTFVRSDPYEVNRLLRRPPFLLLLEDLLARIGLKYSDRIITVNDRLRESTSSRYRIGPEKISVLTNHIQSRPERFLPIDLCRKELGLNSEDFVVITASVLDQRKNVEILIRSGAFLTAPAVFLIVGDGPEKRRLQQLAEEANGKARFVFSGWQRDLSPFFGAADLFVTTSQHEGCSNSLLEALAWDLPCLASDLPEIREVLPFERLLFRPNDAAALAEKISRAVLDQASLEQMRKACAEAREKLRFDWDKAVIHLHEAVFHRAA